MNILNKLLIANYRSLILNNVLNDSMYPRNYVCTVFIFFYKYKEKERNNEKEGKKTQ